MKRTSRHSAGGWVSSASRRSAPVVRGGLRDDSDLDFLVEFDLSAGIEGYADRYFDLLEALEQLFRRPVDLVVDSAIKNPYFRESVDETRELRYAA